MRSIYLILLAASGITAPCLAQVRESPPITVAASDNQAATLKVVFAEPVSVITEEKHEFSFPDSNGLVVAILARRFPWRTTYEEWRELNTDESISMFKVDADGFRRHVTKTKERAALDGGYTIPYLIRIEIDSEQYCAVVFVSGVHRELTPESNIPRVGARMDLYKLVDGRWKIHPNVAIPWLLKLRWDSPPELLKSR